MALSAIGNQLKNFGNDIIGNNEKALLIIKDRRGASGGGLPNVGKSGLFGKLTTAEAASELVGKANSGEGVTKTLKVAFNPSEVNFFVSTNPVMYQDAQKSEQAIGGAMEPSSPRVFLDTKLYFDKCDISDAFMSGRTLSAYLGSAVSGLQQIGMGAMGKKAFTVLPYVKGMLAALMNPSTRDVTFKWGRFEFAGKLNKIDTNMIMFSTSGEPIRTTIHITIEQVYSGENSSSTNAFMTAFDNVFGTSDVSTITKNSTLSKVLKNNFLNMG